MLDGLNSPILLGLLSENKCLRNFMYSICIF